MSKKQYNFRIDTVQLEKLESVSEKQNVDVSDLIRIFIKIGLSELKNKPLAKYVAIKGV